MIERFPELNPTSGELTRIMEEFCVAPTDELLQLSKLAMVRWWSNAQKLPEYNEHFAGIDNEHRKKSNDILLSFCSTERRQEFKSLVDALNRTAISKEGDDIRFNYSGDRKFVQSKDIFLDPYCKKVNKFADEIYDRFLDHGQGELFLARITEILVHYIYSFVVFFTQSMKNKPENSSNNASSKVDSAAPRSSVAEGSKAGEQAGKKWQRNKKRKNKKKGKK
eukprot:CAMPEP_0117736664 /NCGR_PEP_ID=MMETSP0947-20121206/2066_1 /TAXON_ID=44440 /ORGANISM="Chattonella subsalsa, Strain CCMP2191" /LENGTH=221 /DNA_ID=CAMNT_0005552001 /DNA_START=249 /DNA_END=914 /DNA_ORIENTATION=-